MKNNIALFALLTFLLVFPGCDNPAGGTQDGPDPSTDPPETIAFQVVGTTQYSPDGGSSTQEASFKFAVPEIQGRSADSTHIVPVVGILRADDFMIEINGTYHYQTGEFCITASGTIVSTKIDLTINGTYQASQDPQVPSAISEGTTTVVVTDTTTQDSAVFTSTVISAGDSATNSIEEAEENPGSLDVAETVSQEDRKFWEGTWTGSYRMYFTPVYNGDTIVSFSESTEPTEYWMEQVMTMMVTERQYNCSTSFHVSSSYSPYIPEGYLESREYYFVMVIDEILEENESSMTGIFYYQFNEFITDAMDRPYQKTTVYLPEPGYLWGYNYRSDVVVDSYDGGTPDDPSDDYIQYLRDGVTAHEVRDFSISTEQDPNTFFGAPGYARVE